MYIVDAPATYLDLDPQDGDASMATPLSPLLLEDWNVIAMKSCQRKYCNEKLADTQIPPYPKTLSKACDTGKGPKNSLPDLMFLVRRHPSHSDSKDSQPLANIKLPNN